MLEIKYNSVGRKGNKGGSFENVCILDVACNGWEREKETEIEAGADNLDKKLRVVSKHYKLYTTVLLDDDLAEQLREIEHSDSVEVTDTDLNKTWKVIGADFQTEFEQQGCCQEISNIKFLAILTDTTPTNVEEFTFPLGSSYDCTLNSDGTYDSDASTTKTARVGQIVYCPSALTYHVYNGSSWTSVSHVVDAYVDNEWELPADPNNGDRYVVINRVQIWEWDGEAWDKTDVGSGEIVGCLDVYGFFLESTGSMTDYSALGLTTADYSCVGKYNAPELQQGQITGDYHLAYHSHGTSGWYLWGGSSWSVASGSLSTGQVIYAPSEPDGYPGLFFKWTGSTFIPV